MALQNTNLKVFLRIIIDILLFLSIFILPWWITILFIFIAIFLYRKFYEGIFWALYISLFYKGTGGMILGFDYDIFIIIILFFILSSFVRKFFRF